MSIPFSTPESPSAPRSALAKLTLILSAMTILTPAAQAARPNLLAVNDPKAQNIIPAAPRSTADLSEALGTQNSSLLWVPIGPLTGSATLGGSQFAREKSVNPRLEVDVRWKPQDELSEIRFLGFVEGGEGADRNLDLDPVVYRKAIADDANSHLWIGRTHPMNESDIAPGGFAVYPSRTTALGANWGQNSASALDSRVSGWLSAGVHHRFSDSGFHVTGAFSPIFLPNFGPSTSMEANKAATGSRFARLPPSYVRMNDALLPLRYQVQIDELKDILLQNQAFVSGGQNVGSFEYTLMAWTAPSPTPTVDTSAKLRTQLKDEVNVLVTAKPKFPRENFIGTRLSFFQLFAKPELEANVETTSGRITLSANMALDLGKHILSLGALHTVNRPKVDPAEGQPESPNYADALVWAELQSYFSNRFAGNLRYEQHLTPGKMGNWLRPEIEYLPGTRVRFYANVSILTGADYSYFGTWRALDSVGVGARIIW